MYNHASGSVCNRLTTLKRQGTLANMISREPQRTARLLVSYTEAGEMLGGISRTTLWELAKAGQLTRVNIGRRTFITRESIDAYIARLAETKQ